MQLGSRYFHGKGVKGSTVFCWTMSTKHVCVMRILYETAVIAESYATPKPVTIGLLLLAQIHKHINGELTMTYRLNIQDISERSYSSMLTYIS